MKKKIITSAFILLALPLIFVHAQWEKLPLFGGHAEKLIQSKFNPNDIFAITLKSGVWYSSDGGDNWRSINGDKSELIGKDIIDIEVAKDSSLFIAMNRKLYRSMDWGKTWIEEEVGPDIQFFKSNIESTMDGTLWVYAVKKVGSGTFLLKSTDFSETWFEFPLPVEVDWRFTNFYVDPSNSNIIFLFGSWGLLTTTNDGGKTWYTSQTMKDYRYIYPPVKYTDGSSRYGVWTYYDGTPFWYDYYESCDSGMTWNKKNLNPFVGPRSLSKLTLNSIQLSNNNLMTPAGNSYYTSTDDGKTWNIYTNIPIWDVLDVNGLLVGSFTLDGIKYSTDFGNIWYTDQNRIGINALASIEFITANKEVLFAIVQDEVENNSRYQFRQSTDAGNTWKVLFESPSIHNLNVISSSPSRYLAISRNEEIITGTIDQSVPDTLFKSGTSPIYNLQVSGADPNTIYFLAGSTFGRFVYFSTNGGKNWDSTLTPAFLYKSFCVYPSRMNAGTLIAVGVLGQTTDILGAGIFLSTDYGKSAHMIVNADLVSSYRYTLFGNDILYDWWTFSFSSDFGITWQRNDTGLPEDFKQSNAVYSYESRGKLIIGRSADLYFFENGHWVQRTNSHGKNEEWNPPGMLSIVGNDVYASFPYEGLFRYRNALITDTKSPENYPKDFQLYQNYPNPFGAATLTGNPNTTIQFSLSRTDFVTIKIYNTLGEEVETLVSDHYPVGTYQVNWNAIDFPGGVYFCRMIADKFSATKKLMLVK